MHRRPADTPEAVVQLIPSETASDRETEHGPPLSKSSDVSPAAWKAPPVSGLSGWCHRYGPGDADSGTPSSGTTTIPAYPQAAGA